MTPAMISAAVFMVTVGAAILLWIRGDLAAGSVKRMAGMMARAGLDPVALGDPQAKTMLKAPRRRCRRCPSEDLCDRWLAGTVPGGNAFCPNAQTFRSLSAAEAATA